jgi:hypothetical protein
VTVGNALCAAPQIGRCRPAGRIASLPVAIEAAGQRWEVAPLANALAPLPASTGSAGRWGRPCQLERSSSGEAPARDPAPLDRGPRKLRPVAPHEASPYVLLVFLVRRGKECLQFCSCGPSRTAPSTWDSVTKPFVLPHGEGHCPSRYGSDRVNGCSILPWLTSFGASGTSVGPFAVGAGASYAL